MNLPLSAHDPAPAPARRCARTGLPGTVAVAVAVAVAFVSSSCGEPSGRTPGPKPDELLFWRIGAPQSTTAGCGDAAELDALVRPPSITQGDHLVLQVSEDGATADWLRCASREAWSCERLASDPVFAIEGTVLTYQRSTVVPIEESGGCNLEASETWTLTDQGTRLDAVVTRRHALLDGAQDCSSVEYDLRARSTNGAGVDGCELATGFTAQLD